MLVKRITRHCGCITYSKVNLLLYMHSILNYVMSLIE